MVLCDDENTKVRGNSNAFRKTCAISIWSSWSKSSGTKRSAHDHIRKFKHTASLTRAASIIAGSGRCVGVRWMIRSTSRKRGESMIIGRRRQNKSNARFSVCQITQSRRTDAFKRTNGIDTTIWTRTSRVVDAFVYV